jgi:hypothetical protein
MNEDFERGTSAVRLNSIPTRCCRIRSASGQPPNSPGPCADNLPVPRSAARHLNKGQKCHQAAFASTLLPPVLLQCYCRRACLPDKRRKGPALAAMTTGAPAPLLNLATRSPDKVPENIEFAVQELLEAPANQRAAMLEGTAKTLTRRLLKDNPGIGAREVPERVRAFITRFGLALENLPPCSSSDTEYCGWS